MSRYSSSSQGHQLGDYVYNILFAEYLNSRSLDHLLPFWGVFYSDLIRGPYGSVVFVTKVARPNYEVCKHWIRIWKTVPGHSHNTIKAIDPEGSTIGFRETYNIGIITWVVLYGEQSS
jgi:hypothetical protein